jgi:dihydrofolate reductase
MPRPILSLVAAVARDGGIGMNGQLLVRLPEDMRRLKQMTLGSPILMGRKTWDSIGRPLPGRHNIVLTRNPGWSADGASRVDSLAAALALSSAAERLFVLGGADIYALALPHAHELELTELDAVFTADTYFPAWNPADFRQTARDDRETAEGLHYSFVSYAKLS